MINIHIKISINIILFSIYMSTNQNIKNLHQSKSINNNNNNKIG